MKPTLVVLAAGLGSRYGGLKQVDGVGPAGETLLDYTVYDAIKVGFGKIVLVIRSSMANQFIPRMTKHFGEAVELAFVNQEVDDVPGVSSKSENRIKPWGTAHAMWSARNEVSTPFCIVNADDFYGRNAFQEMLNLLLNMNDGEHRGCMVGYRMKETLSDHGSVSRGVCKLVDGNLRSIIEFKAIEKKGDQIIGSNEGETIELTSTDIVSMNLMGFSASVFSLIKTEFITFLDDYGHDLETEFYAPSILQSLIESGVQVPVKVTNSTWFGVTYPDDKALVEAKILRLIKTGTYPNNLFWSK